MGPKTLTMPEFIAHPVGQRAVARGLKPKQAYNNYLHYLAAHRGGHGGGHAAAPRLDPLAPLGEHALAGQVSSAVSAQTDPLISRINREASANVDRVDAATRVHADRLKAVAPVVGGAFGRATDAAAGVGDVLANRLAASGQEQGGSLRQALAGMDAPQRLVDQVAGGVEQFGRGASNAGFALQTGTVRDLLARRAEAEGYAGMLPGFAEAEGASYGRGIEQQAAKDVGGVRDKIPGLIADLLDSGRNREVQKAIALEGIRGDKAARQADVAAGRAEARAKAADERKPDSTLSNTLGYLVNSSGQPILDQHGQPIPTRAAVNDAASPSADQEKAQKAHKDAVHDRQDAVSTSTGTARTLARKLYQGTTEEKLVGGKLVGKKVKVTTRKEWAEAYRIVYNEIAGDLMRYGVKRTRIGQIVDQALRDAGFHRGGYTSPGPK